MFRNLSVSMTMYGGQMCTTPRTSTSRAAACELPAKSGIRRGRCWFHRRHSGSALGRRPRQRHSWRDQGRARPLTGWQSPRHLESVLLESREIKNSLFPDAVVHTPVSGSCRCSDKETYMREMFGPVIYVIATDSTKQSLELATESASRQGAITWLVYSTDPDGQDAAEDAAVEAGVSIAFNLTGGLFVNQSAAFSDFPCDRSEPGRERLADRSGVHRQDDSV